MRRRYTQQRERVIYGALGGFGEAPPKGSRSRTMCASRKMPFKWLRIDPCVTRPPVRHLPPVRTSADAARLFHETVGFANSGVEYAMVMALDIKNVPTGIAVAHIGGRAFSMIDPTVVFQPVVLTNASGFILAHNHPSGSTEPSEADGEMIQKLATGARYVGVRLVDALILTDDGKLFSFLDAGILPSG
jgi:DNA repair protein RadC